MDRGNLWYVLQPANPLCCVRSRKKTAFFAFDWKAQRWNLIVATGAVVGGFLAANYLSNSTAVNISASTIAQLNQLGINDAGSAYMPSVLFDLSAFSNLKSILLLSLEAFLLVLVRVMQAAVLLAMLFRA